MFWLTVAVAYALIISVGLSLGLYLAQRFPRPGGGTAPVEPEPLPEGPCRWCALGNDHDRALIPGIAWDDAALTTEHVHDHTPARRSG